MSQEFWIRIGERKKGPFSGKRLRAFASTGELKPDYLISRDCQRWVPASQVKGLTFLDTRITTEAPDRESEDEASACIAENRMGSVAETSLSQGPEPSAVVTLEYPQIGTSILMNSDRHHMTDVSMASKKVSLDRLVVEIVLIPLLYPIIVLVGFVMLIPGVLVVRILFLWADEELDRFAANLTPEILDIAITTFVLVGIFSGIAIICYLPYHIWLSVRKPPLEDPQTCLKHFLRLIKSFLRQKMAFQLLTDEARSGYVTMHHDGAEVLTITDAQSFEAHWEAVNKICSWEPQWKEAKLKLVSDTSTIITLPFKLWPKYVWPFPRRRMAPRASVQLDYTASFLLVKRSGSWFVASPWFWPHPEVQRMLEPGQSPQETCENQDTETHKMRSKCSYCGARIRKPPGTNKTINRCPICRRVLDSSSLELKAQVSKKAKNHIGSIIARKDMKPKVRGFLQRVLLWS
jgi:hypothetical protein